MSGEYDWRVDAYESWLLAIVSIRERLIAAHKIAPRDEADDLAWLERMRSRDIPDP